MNDATAAYSALGVWVRRQGAKSIDSFCGAASGLCDEITKLERYLHGRAPAQARWDGRALLAKVKIARASRRAVDRQLKRRSPALPALNPW